MSTFLKQLKWQFILLHKNDITVISFGITIIYGGILYFVRDVGNLDKVLVSLVLLDPTVIGYFLIALAIYTEIKQQVLQAIFVTPVNIHHFLLAKVVSLSIIGAICSLGLAVSVKGLDFDIATYTIGSFGICILSSLLGLMILTFASEFLKFAMLSAPVFIIFVNISLLQYLGAIDIGVIKYILPIQGSVDLIDNAISGTSINIWYSYISIIILIPVFYRTAYRLFTNRIVYQ
jgi:fluoroquinolone transport system permease protein